MKPISFTLGITFVSLIVILGLTHSNYALPIIVGDPVTHTSILSESDSISSEEQKNQHGPAAEVTSPTLFFTAYLPLVSNPPGTLYGVVLEHGAPLSGITITLHYCREYALNYLGDRYCADQQTFYASTDEAGRYDFLNMPTLTTSGQLSLPQTYAAFWINQPHNQGRLSSWWSKEITTYVSGDRMNLGSFDVEDITLLSPEPEITVTLPTTFRWQPRPQLPSDQYGICIELPRYPRVGCDQPLGYVDQFALAEAFDGIVYNVYYIWTVQVYDPSGGVGWSNFRGFQFAK